MSRKKLIILVTSITVLVLAGATIGFLALKNRTQSKKTCDVFPMAEVAMSGGYYGNYDYMGGSVVADKEQNIYLTSTDKVQDVFVSEGDVVHAGDLLLVYDTTAQSLQLDLKRAEVEIARTNVLMAEKQLTELQNTTPVEPTTEEPSTEEPSTEEAPPTEAPKTEEPSTEEPPETATPTDAGEGAETTEEPTAPEEPSTEAPDQEEPPEDPAPEGVTYTKEELDKAIESKKREINDLKVSYQLKQLELEIQEAKSQNGEVYCMFDGTVKTVANKDTAIMEHTPYITISSSDGYTVQTTIGELSLDKYHIGDMMTMYCYDTGMSYVGTISEISTKSTSDAWGYSSTLQSYYPMTVIVEDADELRQGMYLEMNPNDYGGGEDDSGSLYLTMAFVKKENGKYYVMKEVDGQLKKVFIQTGGIIWGDTIEIKSGVSLDDYLALPTSKNAKEGVRTVRKTSSDLYSY